MDTDPSVIQGVVHYLIANQEHVKEKIKPFTEQKKTFLEQNGNLFEEEIDKQYEDIVRSTIGDEITAKLGIPLEDVLIVLENLNVKEYLKN